MYVYRFYSNFVFFVFVVAQRIVSSEDLIEWGNDNDDDDDDVDLEEESYETLLQMKGDVVIKDIMARPHMFKPKLLKIVKREAILKKVGISFIL